MNKLHTFLGLMSCCAVALSGQEGKLPKPNMGGISLMSALEKRSSQREFSTQPLSREHLAGLCWAALGVNRPADKKRTAPTARNRQEITLYLVMAQGLFRYEPENHSLAKVKDGDLRALTGSQSFVAEAPLNVIFVAEGEKMGNASAEQKAVYGAFDTGYVSQNIYLYCAAQNLATVVRGSVDKEKLHGAMGLKETHQIVGAQTVGYMKSMDVKAGAQTAKPQWLQSENGEKKKLP